MVKGLARNRSDQARMSRHEQQGYGAPRRSRAIEADLRFVWQSSGLADSVRALVVSSNGAIAVVGQHGRVKILHDSAQDSAVLGSVKHDLAGQEGGIASAVASAKELLIAGGVDGFIKWWHLDSGQEIASTRFPDTSEPSPVLVMAPRAAPWRRDPASASPHSSSTHLVAAASGRLVQCKSVCMWA